MSKMTIAHLLIPLLRERFPDRGLKITGSSQPCAIFPAIHPEVGDVEIHDDSDELTLCIGQLTHGHFSNYDSDLSFDQKAQAIIDETLEFLHALFADRIGIWGVFDVGGGWYHLDASANGRDQGLFGVGAAVNPGKAKHYVWSGPRQMTRSSD